MRNEREAEAVRFIYRRYLDLKCLRRLKAELDQKGIVSKRRTNASGRQPGGVKFTYGPLAYLLKNRTYLGEMGHKGAWFDGEHAAIVDPALFNAVQDLLKSNSVVRRQHRSDNQALLKGLLFDDRGNRMSPSFTSKRGVRYRFYVSSATLTGRGNQGACVRRVSASELERAVVVALREQCPQAGEVIDHDLVAARIERVVLDEKKISIALKALEAGQQTSIVLTRAPRSLACAQIDTGNCRSIPEPNDALVQALVRAHCWRKALADGVYQSVEELAGGVAWNAKVLRKALRVAFLAPDITESIMRGSQPHGFNLSQLQGISAYSWREQRRLLGLSAT